MKINLFNSLKFKLPLALAIVSYLFTLLFMFANSINSGMHQKFAKNSYHVWFDNHFSLPVTESLKSANQLAESIEIKRLLKEAVNKSFTLDQNLNNDNNKSDITIVSMAIVDNNAHQIAQWGEQLFSQGDIGAQLPIKARDDLADALIGHYNSGIELLQGQERLVIKSIQNQQQQIIGAIISKQLWRKDMLKVRPLSLLTLTPINDILLFSLLPLLLIIPVSIVIVLVATKQFRQQIEQLYTTLSYWTQGQLDHRISIKTNDEIGLCFIELNKMAQQLDSQIKQNHQLVAANERQYLAAELHDTVKQQLFSNNLALASCNQLLTDNRLSQAQQIIANVIKTNQQAFNQVNQLITTLHQPTEIKIKSFNEKIRQQILAWQDASSVEVNSDIAINSSISSESQHLIQRVLGEALQNIAKHAQANWVKIAMVENRNSLLITIADNGVGNHHLIAAQGLTLMKQRLITANGQLNITQTEDLPVGVQLNICLPL